MGQHPTGEDPLIETLRAIAEEDAPLGPSSDVDLRLRRAVRTIGQARRRRVYAVALAATAGLLIAILWPAGPTVVAPSPVGSERVEAATEFLPLMYRDVPMSESRIVRLEVSRDALIMFGLSGVDTIARSSPETVLADVVVGEDGLARAIRFVKRER
jgi:hypothetical protein